MRKGIPVSMPPVMPRMASVPKERVPHRTRIIKGGKIVHRESDLRVRSVNRKTYKCPICGQEYENRSDARDCAQEPIQPLVDCNGKPLKVGDVVFNSNISVFDSFGEIVSIQTYGHRQGFTIKSVDGDKVEGCDYGWTKIEAADLERIERFFKRTRCMTEW